MSTHSRNLTATATRAYWGVLSGDVDPLLLDERLRRGLANHDLRAAVPEYTSGAREDNIRHLQLVEEKQFSDLGLQLLTIPTDGSNVFVLAGSRNGSILKYFIVGVGLTHDCQHPLAEAMLSWIGANDVDEAWALLSAGIMRMMLARIHPSLSRSDLSLGGDRASARVVIETTVGEWEQTLSLEPGAFEYIAELAKDCYRAHARQTDLLPTLHVLVRDRLHQSGGKPITSAVVSTQ